MLKLVKLHRLNDLLKTKKEKLIKSTSKKIKPY